MFADLDKYYPGSKRKRRDAPAVENSFPTPWTATSIKKLYNGVETDFYTVNALATALGKSVVTLRLWERKGYIPKAPFRLPAYKKDGSEVSGKRVYTRSLIEISVEEFAKRDLLGSERVEWKYHEDLTIALYEQWNAIINS